MREDKTHPQRPVPDPEKKLTRRATLGALGLISAAGVSAVQGKLYAKAAITASLKFEAEPGSPMSG